MKGLYFKLIILGEIHTSGEQKVLQKFGVGCYKFNKNISPLNIRNIQIWDRVDLILHVISMLVSISW